MVRVSAQTKQLLDELQEARGARTHDALIAELLEPHVDEGIAQELRAIRRRPLPATYEVDVSEELEPLHAEIAALRAQLEAFTSLVIVHPGTGQMYHALNLPHGIDGKAGTKNKGWGGGVQRGAWVRVPWGGDILDDGHDLTERDGTLPAALVAALKAEAEQRAAAEAEKAKG